MATGIPLPGSMIDTLMNGLNTGSTVYSRAMQPIIDRERLAQQQNQFVQNLALQKEAEGRQQSLMPFLIQQYKDAHQAAANEAALKGVYLKAVQDAASGNTPTVPGAQPAAIGGATPGAAGNVLDSSAGLPGAPTTTTAGAPALTTTPPAQVGGAQDIQELRPGNPRLVGLDRLAGLLPGVPKADTKISNGMIITTYPSGRMTAQSLAGTGAQTPGQATVSAKEASKIRDSATNLINSANLVQQGYDLLDNNPNLTSPVAGLESQLNISNKPELGEFNTVAGKLQAELGKYASQRGGIQAVKWAGSVKPSAWKPQDYNYGMFQGIQQNLENDYNTLNQQYKSQTGKDLPVALPQMKSSHLDDVYVQKAASTLMQVNPNYTPENIKATAATRKIPVREVVNQLMKKTGLG